MMSGGVASHWVKQLLPWLFIAAPLFAAGAAVIAVAEYIMPGMTASGSSGASCT
jgi:hypothetical protein